MTYESLVAGFRLRVLKTEEDYAAAKAFWEDEVSFVLKHCKMADSDGVEEYSEVLTLLMALYEKTKLDDYDEEDDEPDVCIDCEGPVDPEIMTCEACAAHDEVPNEEDWVTTDHLRFYRHGMSGHAVMDFPLDTSWDEVRTEIVKYMNETEYWPTVWFVSDHGNYHILSLEDDK